MRHPTAALLLAGLLAGWLATASATERDEETAVLTIAQSATSQECASLAQQERDARKRGDWWRADQLQDEYERECLNRGR